MMSGQGQVATATKGVGFARRVFTGAAVYGILVLFPQYFLAAKIGIDYPPAITHPEYFYGFVGVALAWQVLFLMIARDPVRFRPAMIVAILEKLAFGPVCLVLYWQQRLPVVTLGAGLLDLVLAVLFLISFRMTGR
jgi:hypothetical protein